MKTKIWGCILGAVMFASALQSCQTQVEIPDGAVYPILFGSTESRAVAGLEQIKSGGFKVYAYFEGNKGSSSFAKDVKHAVVEEKDYWSFETPEYWIPNTNYWFKAVYPGGIGNVDNDSSEQTFTISDLDISKQQDVMVATATASVAENATAPTSGSVVNLTFEHLLANVVIKALSEINTPISVERIELRDISVGADYNGRSWNSSTPKGTYGINSNMQLTKATSDTDFKDITNGGLLVIPEQINGTQKLYVKTSFKEYEIAFPTIYSWNSGQRYTYTLVIKQENIEFNEPKVEIWDEENATGSVVIK